MKTVVLNWNGGENDPFTEVNRSIAEMFRRCGKLVQTLEITDPTWAEQLGKLTMEGVDFAYTWQGLGSNIVLDETNESIWEIARVPLICVHGDHPSYMPANHIFESKYCFHLYTNTDFSRYSNKYFRRNRSSFVIDIPQIFFEKPLEVNGEKTFNIVKNIRHTDDIEAEWVKILPEFALNAFLRAAETLKLLVKTQSYFEVHDALDEQIKSESWDWLSEQQNPGLIHRFHSGLDYYVRSFKAMSLLDELRDVPLNIYGRGWEQFKKNAPKKWKFYQGIEMAESQRLYYSLYGIIDVSPSKRLHDRTRRAMSNGQSFLSSANLEDSFNDFQSYQDLFFDFRLGQLRDKCEAVMENPIAHQERAREFANLYHDKFHFQNFVNRLDSLALSVDRF